MEVFGQLFGHEDKAAEFNKFYTSKVDDIKSRAEKAGDKPRTLVWRAAGLKDCCSTVKDSNLGDLVNAVGGGTWAIACWTPSLETLPQKGAC